MNQQTTPAVEIARSDVFELGADLRAAAATVRNAARVLPAAEAARAKGRRALARRLDDWADHIDPPDDGAVYYDAAGQRTETR